MSKIQNPSLPKDKIKFLLLEGISETAIRQLEIAGYPCVERQAKALEEDALKAALKDVRLLGIRSRTKMTESVFAATGFQCAVFEHTQCRGADDCGNRHAVPADLPAVGRGA